MLSYLINLREDYRFTLLLALLFHILLVSLLLVTLHHLEKPFFLSTSAPPPIIQATVLNSSELPNPNLAEQEVIKSPPKAKKVIIKPELIEKSPIFLPSKEKKTTKAAADTRLISAKPHVNSELHIKKHSNKQVQSNKPAANKKNTHSVLPPKSLQMVQKNVQELLQQEVSTMVQEKQWAARNASTMEKYRHLILQSIAQQWIIPPELNKRLETKLTVRLAPGGMVLEVIIVKSSGNSVLDRSAQTAVYKASPLPVPKNTALFNAVRQIDLTVRPEGMLN